MADVATGETWSARLTHSIGEQIRRHRLEQHMTVQSLADRCAESGLPMGRVAITKLERGMREGVSVAELVVLASVLDVAPGDLLVPVERDGTVEMLPGDFVPARDAAEWFATGRAGLRDIPTIGELRHKVAELARLTGPSARGEWPDAYT